MSNSFSLYYSNQTFLFKICLWIFLPLVRENKEKKTISYFHAGLIPGQNLPL